MQVIPTLKQENFIILSSLFGKVTSDNKGFEFESSHQHYLKTLFSTTIRHFELRIEQNNGK